MPLVDRYLLISLIRGGSPVLLGLLALFGFIELAEQLEDVGKGAFSSPDALRIVALSLPRIGIDVLPVSCLLGTLVGLGTLANQSELTAMRAGGLGIRRLAAPLLALLGILILAVAAFQEYLIPGLERQAADLRARALSTTSVQGGEHWTKSGSSLVRVGSVRFGLVPQDIEIYDFGADGRIVRLTQAASADVVSANEWLLHEVSTTRFGPAATVRSQTERLPWRNRIGAEQLGAIVRAEHALAPTELAAYIAYLRDNGLDSYRYRLLLWHQLSLPFGIAAMALLGLPFVTGSTRTTPLGTRLAAGGAVGIAFYLLERTVTQVGLLYQLPAAAAGLAPDLLLLAAALAAILRMR